MDNDIIKLVYIGSIHLSNVSLSLTINKMYNGRIIFDDFDNSKSYYDIDKNDNGVNLYYPTFLFNSLDEFGNERIINILENGY